MSGEAQNIQVQDLLSGAIYLAETDTPKVSSGAFASDLETAADPLAVAPAHGYWNAPEADIAADIESDTRDPLSFEEVMDLEEIVEEASAFQTAAGAAGDPQTAIDTGGNGIFVPYESPELFAGLEAIGALAPV